MTTTETGTDPRGDTPLMMIDMIATTDTLILDARNALNGRLRGRDARLRRLSDSNVPLQTPALAR